jgi:putative transposase
MFDLFCLWFGAALRIFRNPQDLLLENLTLRHPLTTFKRRHPKPRLGVLDELFWVAARQFWSQWKQSLLLVMPETVVRWHRAGFRLYWTVLCQPRNPVGGGKRISKEIRDLIFQMVVENPTWGAPRIHGELLMLGFDVS